MRIYYLPNPLLGIVGNIKIKTFETWSVFLAITIDLWQIWQRPVATQWRWLYRNSMYSNFSLLHMWVAKKIEAGLLTVMINTGGNKLALFWRVQDVFSVFFFLYLLYIILNWGTKSEINTESVCQKQISESSLDKLETNSKFASMAIFIPVQSCSSRICLLSLIEFTIFSHLQNYSWGRE